MKEILGVVGMYLAILIIMLACSFLFYAGLILVAGEVLSKILGS